MPPEIKALTRNYMNRPEYITVTRGEITVPLTKQVYYKVLETNKTEGLCRVLDSESIELGMIFCRTKKGVDQLTDELQERGYMARGLHGDLNQQQRDQVMKAFRDHSIELLVATDVAARGIDVGNVTHVINYDIPQDPESYVHRIGRTGRAGKTGIAMTFVTPREMKLLRSIETQIKTKIEPKALPTIEDIEENLQKTWMNQISELIQSDDDVSFYAEMVNQLQKNYTAEKIAAVALKMLFQRRIQQDFDDYDFGETGAAPGMVRLFVNLGHNAQLTPKDFIQLISEEADIPRKSIGKISIFDRFSFVEVPESDAPFVLEGIQHTSVNGHRLYVAPAHPRNAKNRE
jgi:ATP-dependent RNA helicase DeaD